MVHGLEEQFGLAAVPAVDGAGGDASPTSDLGHSGPLVPLLGEHLGCRVQQPVGEPIGLRVVSGDVLVPGLL